MSPDLAQAVHNPGRGGGAHRRRFGCGVMSRWSGRRAAPRYIRSMAMHRFQVSNRWTGNLGSGTSNYTAYSRNHEISGAAKSAPIAGCSDKAFRGDSTRYNPEELTVGALSACHMLWMLHLCADAGIVVTEYSDEASGDLALHRDGAGEITAATLRPRMTITDAASTSPFPSNRRCSQPSPGRERSACDSGHMPAGVMALPCSRRISAMAAAVAPQKPAKG